MQGGACGGRRPWQRVWEGSSPAAPPRRQFEAGRRRRAGTLAGEPCAGWPRQQAGWRLAGAPLRHDVKLTWHIPLARNGVRSRGQPDVGEPRCLQQRSQTALAADQQGPSAREASSQPHTADALPRPALPCTALPRTARPGPLSQGKPPCLHIRHFACQRFPPPLAACPLVALPAKPCRRHAQAPGQGSSSLLFPAGSPAQSARVRWTRG